MALGGTLNFEPSAVNDGNALADCLVQLVPESFTHAWRARIINETGGNWKLRVSYTIYCDNEKICKLVQLRVISHKWSEIRYY